MPRTKKPKVQIKREKTSLGWAYRIYIDGAYMGTGLTAASAREGAKRMLVIYLRTMPQRFMVTPQRTAGDRQGAHAVFTHVAQGRHAANPAVPCQP